MENVRKPKDIKFESTEIRRNYLLSEPNYHATKCFIEYLIAEKNSNTYKLPFFKFINLNLSNTVLYEF